MAPFPRPFPLVDQLHSQTLDGFPDEDAGDNCVPASIAACLRDLTNLRYVPDQLHDAVYGQGYFGGQAARAYVLYCGKQGVRLSPTDGTPDALVALLVQQVRSGHPCLLTIPSHWNTPPSDPLHPGASHVVAAFDTDGERIAAMNPWGGFVQIEPLAWWEARLCYNEVWTLQLTEEVPPMAIEGIETLGAGFQAYLAQHNITDGRVIQGETYDQAVLPAGESFAALDLGAAGGTIVLHYKADVGVDTSDAGNIVARFYAEIVAQRQAVAQLQAQAAASATSGSVEALAVIRDLKAALANVQ